MLNIDDLKELQKLVEELQTTNSNNEKKVILAKYPQCKQLLFYVYNPFYQFYVTSQNCKKRLDLTESLVPQDIYNLLDSLRTRKITGHQALASVNVFVEWVQREANYTDLIYNIIDKNLKVRIDSAILNSVWPGLIPDFSVALAKSYDKLTKKPNLENETWFLSRKLDGVRVVILKEKNSIKAFSRTGNEFETLEKVKAEIAKLPIDDVAFDGELCLIDESGAEDFQGIMKEIRKKDHAILNPKYMMFDLIPINEFYEKQGSIPLEFRLQALLDVMQNYEGDILHVLNQDVIKDQYLLNQKLELAVQQGYEGMMLRKNIGYEGKRTNNLLKLKKFEDSEYKVLSINVGPMRVFIDGKEQEIEVMTDAIIQHQGYNVGVGSGWSVDQRIDFQKNPEKIVGKTIKVQYFEETKNQDGGISLRFPTVKHIYGENREF